MKLEDYLLRYEIMIKRRDKTFSLLQSESFKHEWFIQRPTEHQWAIDELLRHMIGNEIRYLQIPLDESITQHEIAVRAQWVGKTLFRLEETPHHNIEEIQQVTIETQQKSQALLASLSYEDLHRKKKAPWGERIPYREMLQDLFDHDQFHRGQVHFLITYFSGLPQFQSPSEDVNYG